MSGGGDTVGSLLASIATRLSECLRIFTFADKRQWGADEHEQTRALEDVLDDAKRDFQEMGPLVNGQIYYENDRRPESLAELRALLTKFDAHLATFKAWVKTGGPINPLWARDTANLGRELHRAQCQAARRVFDAEQGGDVGGSAQRCLGAFQVWRQQRRGDAARARDRERTRRRLMEGQRGESRERMVGLGPLPPGPEPPGRDRDEGYRERGAADGKAVEGEVRTSEQDDGASQPQQRPRQGSSGVDRRVSLEELVPACNAVGKFERLGEHDVAFVCDFCDGFIVWEDLQSMPSVRTPLSSSTEDADPASGYPNWQATGRSATADEEKTVAFAPLVIANHLPPEPRDWQARIRCPYCDDYEYYAQGDDEVERLRYVQDDGGFDDLATFQEHLEWEHTAVAKPALAAAASALPSLTSNCLVM